MMMDLEFISSYIFLSLKCCPGFIGIRPDEDGWVSCRDLVNCIRADLDRDFDYRALEKIVADDEEDLFAFNENGSKFRVK